MHQVIARAWRPQKFAQVIGQKHVTQTLQNAIRLNRIGHGYVFSGLRGTGKTSVARLLAKAVNCRKGPAPEPCGECDSCQEIAAGRSVDVIEIDAASNRGIDAVRELRENVRYAPARDRYKVFIIDEAHQITPEGFNALLKTLEEPPAHVIFILATTEIHELPDTILSRCQHFAFRSVSFNEVLEDLRKICAAEGIEAEAQALAALAAAAQGSLRDAQSRLEQAITAFGNRLEGAAVLRLLGAVPSQLVEDVFHAVREQKRERVLEVVARLVEDGYQLPHFCLQLIRAVRNMLVIKLAGARPDLLESSPEEAERLRVLAEGFSQEDLSRFLEILLQLHQQLRYTMEPRFYMELGLLKLVEAERLVGIEELLATELKGGPRGSSQATAGTAQAGASPYAGAPTESKERESERSLSPFERDTLRKLRAAETAGPSSRAPQPPATNSGMPDAASRPPREQAATEGDITQRAVEQGGTSPTQPEHWAAEVARRLEERAKFGLLGLLKGARWEVGEGGEVRLYKPGIENIMTKGDLQTLEGILGEVFGRKTRLTMGAVASAAAGAGAEANAVSDDGAVHAPGERSQPGSSLVSIEDRVREDPEVREFERLFGRRVTGIRKVKE